MADSAHAAVVNEAAQRAGGSSGRILTVVRWVAFAACVLLFVHALAKSDLTMAWERIRAIGPLAVIVMLPFPAALAMDAWAWKVLLAGLDRRVPFFTLLKVRFATEAVTNSAPVGALWADALAPILVARRADVPTEDVFAASTAKRWTVVRMHGTYVAIACAFGASALNHASHHLLGNEVLLSVCFASALALVLLSIGIEALAARGRVAERVSGVLGNARFARVKAWIETRRHRFARADVQLARLSKSPWVGRSAAWRMLGLWIFEGLETFVILRLLGTPLTFLEIMSMDAALSVVRSSAMFAPAGIGVQDVGYLAMLEAYGVPNASSLGPAFIVVKRVKEAIWMGVGFIMLARIGPRAVLKEAKEEIERSSLPSIPPL
jgi:glycosyltransferase 2 family protein